MLVSAVPEVLSLAASQLDSLPVVITPSLVFEYTVFVKNGSDYQSQKILIMRDSTTVHSTEYAVR